MSLGRRAWRLLAAALVAQTSVSVVEQGIPTLAPFIKRDLGLSAALLGVVVVSFQYGRVLGSYAAGRAADAFGDRRTMIAGGLAGGALTVAAAPLPLAGLVAVLVVAGLVAATSTPAGSTLVMTAFPVERRGFAMGIRQTGIPLGGLIAAGLLPFLADRIGWRGAIEVAGGITVLGTLLALAGSRGAGERGRGRHVEERGRRDPGIVLVAVWGTMLVGAQYAIVTYLILDVEQHGLSIGHAAVLLAVAQAGGIVGRIAWGALSDRAFGGDRRPVMLAITACAVAAAVLLALLPGHAGFLALLPVALLAGTSMMGWNGVWVMVVAELAGPHRRGGDLGFALTFVSAGVVVAPPVFGALVDATGDYRVSWLALAGLLVAALLPASLVRGRTATSAAA